MQKVIGIGKRLCFSKIQRIILTVIVISILTIIVLFPEPAYAGFWDVFTNPQEFIAELLRAAANGLFDLFSSFINAIKVQGLITEPHKLLSTSTSGNGQTMWDIAKTVHSTVIVPLGHSILALVMLVQVIKVSQRVDGNATLPAFKEVMQIFVTFVIFTGLINNSLNISSAILDIGTGIANKILGYSATSLDITIAADVTDWGVLMGLILIAGIAALIGLVAYIVSVCVGLARSLQLYIMATFSPIPLALLGFEETRSSGVNFIMNFIALCLAGAIMMFVIICFPVVFSGIVGTATLSISGDASAGDAVINAIKGVAVCVVLIIGLVKSGGWAREIMGR